MGAEGQGSLACGRTPTRVHGSPILRRARAADPRPGAPRYPGPFAAGPLRAQTRTRNGSAGWAFSTASSAVWSAPSTARSPSTFRSGLAPVEITAALRKELDTHASPVARDRVLVPNRFVVRMNPDDHASMTALGAGLIDELTGLLSSTRRSSATRWSRRR